MFMVFLFLVNLAFFGRNIANAIEVGDELYGNIIRGLNEVISDSEKEGHSFLQRYLKFHDLSIYP